MPWTKKDIIKRAFGAIGKQGYEFDIQPEAYQDALQILDGMMAMWGGALGARIGYSGGIGFGDVNAESEVPPWAFQAIYLNLAILLAPEFGKQVSQEARASAKAAYDALLLRASAPRKRYIGGYGGAGNNGRPMPIQEPTIDTGADGILEF